MEQTICRFHIKQKMYIQFFLFQKILTIYLLILWSFELLDKSSESNYLNFFSVDISVHYFLFTTWWKPCLLKVSHSYMKKLVLLSGIFNWKFMEFDFRKRVWTWCRGAPAFLAFLASDHFRKLCQKNDRRIWNVRPEPERNVIIKRRIN